MIKQINVVLLAGGCVETGRVLRMAYLSVPLTSVAGGRVKRGRVAQDHHILSGSGVTLPLHALYEITLPIWY